jgi:hypothetical protein
MKIKIFSNGEELKQEVSDPSRINNLMIEVQQVLPNIIQNVGLLSFLKEHMNNGR